MENRLVVPSRVRSAQSVSERTVANDGAYLESDDSAFCALTDFRREYPITVEVDSSIDDALGHMNRLGIHALLVTRQDDAGNEQQVVGLITYYDIERRRPHRYPQATVSSVRPRIRVADVMTPWNELPLVKYESLQSLTACDLYETFQGTGLTHLLVVENHGYESALARGLVSRAALTIRLHRARAACGR
ncbi:MAG: CBS domain-containing protein [Steroidobacteraceae bacterium]|jgi:CBS domain-containing protein